MYYKQQFKCDFLGDLIKLEKVAHDPSNLDVLSILQMVWAMAKADQYGKTFPPFEEWLASLESVDIADPVFLKAALEEAADGFFRSGVKGAIQK